MQLQQQMQQAGTAVLVVLQPAAAVALQPVEVAVPATHTALVVPAVQVTPTAPVTLTGLVVRVGRTPRTVQVCWMALVVRAGG